MSAPTPPVTLDELPDVLTDADLCRLLRLTPRQLRSMKSRETATGRAVLPPRITGIPHRRYYKADVAQWLRLGGASSRHLRRAS